MQCCRLLVRIGYPPFSSNDNNYADRSQGLSAQIGSQPTAFGGETTVVDAQPTLLGGNPQWWLTAWCSVTVWCYVEVQASRSRAKFCVIKYHPGLGVPAGCCL